MSNSGMFGTKTQSNHPAGCPGRCIITWQAFELCFWSFFTVLLPVLLLPVSFYGQNSEFFDVKSIIRDVKLRFELSPADIHRLGPLIKLENQEVLVIYSRYDGNEEGYPVALWRDMIRGRNDFESRINAGFKSRERAALRTARTALERRVLNYLVDDYINFLADVLELDNLQLEAVAKVMTRECRRKHLLIVRTLSKPALLDTQLDNLANQTDLLMKILLTPEQYRLYRTILVAPDGPVG